MEDIDNRYITDASIIITSLLPDENYNQIAENFLRYYKEGQIQLVGPYLLKYEVVNSLRTAVLHKRISIKYAYEALDKFKKIEIQFIPIDLKTVLNLAVKHRVSGYDASYASLISTLKIPLITADKKLYKNLAPTFKVVWIEEFKKASRPN